RRLNILHLDTGAMYRAIGLAMLEKGIDILDEDAAVGFIQAGGADLAVAFDGGTQRTMLDGRDVSRDIRTEEAGSAASAVSRYRAVRAWLVALQREIAARQSMVIDGRDIGTVVLPDAKMKIFLTASPEVRALRRLKQLEQAGQQATYEAVLSDLKARDDQDTRRAVAPLRQAADAVLLDTTNLSFDEAVDAVLRMVEEQHGTAG
ncbi:MAG: (d)CMP kinase, partial [Clostridiales bacterium]|nr:(d)CMP kinase [Clostridiales bacterium]